MSNLRARPATGSNQVASPDLTKSGKVELNIEAFQDGDPNYQKPDGKGNEGISVKQLRELFGGKDEGDIDDPILGQPQHISLKPWSNSDPAKTFLKLVFRFVPTDFDSTKQNP